MFLQQTSFLHPLTHEAGNLRCWIPPCQNPGEAEHTSKSSRRARACDGTTFLVLRCHLHRVAWRAQRCCKSRYSAAAFHWTYVSCMDVSLQLFLLQDFSSVSDFFRYSLCQLACNTSYIPEALSQNPRDVIKSTFFDAIFTLRQGPAWISIYWSMDIVARRFCFYFQFNFFQQFSVSFTHNFSC